MVTLLRLLGIPARYVEGYVLPSEQAFEEEYTVTNRNAHAWVEVYFEGFGWMVFEPTTAYAGALNYKSAFSALDYQDNPSYKEMMEDIRAVISQAIHILHLIRLIQLRPNHNRIL